MKESPKKTAKRQELMMSIIDIVNNNDFEKLTIRDICNQAGISVGTFYHYFEEKSDIVRILFICIDDYFENNVVPRFVEDELENILIFVTEYAKYCHKSGVPINKVISTAPLMDLNKDYLSNKTRRLSKIIKNVVTRGQEKGQITKEMECDDICRIVLVGMRGYCADWAKCNGNYDIVTSVGLHFKTVLKGLKA